MNDGENNGTPAVREHPRERDPRRRRRFSLLPKFALAGGSVLLVLLVCELALRLVNPQPLAGIMFSQDRQFGFWNRPNLKGKRFQNESNTPFYRVTTDSMGYRCLRPVATTKTPSVKRIVVLGDSYAFGSGVNDADTFPARLEVILNASAIKPSGEKAERFEVVNAACPGWGTENALAFLRARGRQLAPDLLVVAFFRNDLADNMRHLLFQIADGKPVYAPKKGLARIKRLTNFIPFYSFLCDHSQLVNMVRRAIARRMAAPGQDLAAQSRRNGAPPQHGQEKLPGPNSASTKGGANAPTSNAQPARNQDQPEAYRSDSELAEQLKVYAALMEALTDEARAQGVPVLLLVLPGRNDCEPEPLPDFRAVTRLGEKWADEGRIVEMLVLRDVFIVALNNKRKVFLPHDGHYTPQGNRIVAEVLARDIRVLLTGRR